MKFTKYNNPSKKRKVRKISDTDKMIIATKNILTDKKLGYDIPLSTYEQIYRLDTNNEKKEGGKQ